GGLRYLEQMALGLVFESVNERRVLQTIAPHLVRPLGFLFPVFDGASNPLWKINAGLFVYDALSLFRSPKLHRRLNRAGVLAEEPLLRSQGLHGAPLYWDCATDDARLTLETALDAAAHGAVIATGARVTGLRRDASGRLVGADVVDTRTGTTRAVEATVVISATGPYTDALRRAAYGQATTPMLRPTKGVHVVFDAARLPVRHAVVLRHPDDGRVLFAIPWGAQTYVGTTDTDYAGDADQVAADAADVAYVLHATNHYFPGRDLNVHDVVSTWAGLRPLIAPPPSDGSLSASAVSREHQLTVEPDGLVTIAGGKLTTYRRMAAEVVDAAVGVWKARGGDVRRLQAPGTADEPLPGGAGWPGEAGLGAFVDATAAIAGLPRDVAAELVRTYGGRATEVAALVAADPTAGTRLHPDRPEILAMVDWSVREELAHEVADVLIRRTQVFYRAKDQGLSAVAAVAERMAAHLGWSDAERDASAQAYRAEVALHRDGWAPTTEA
ncbi:MAG: hypothetical protein RLZZ383_2660, partial [Pseudomonadota bacterium]